MFKVGLTGNYYSGHKEISQLFESEDIPVFNANLLTKFLINYSPKHIKKIKSVFGDSIYHLGLLEVKKFDTDKKFDKLLEIVEPDIFISYVRFQNVNMKSPYTIFLYDFIFERNLQKKLDYNINCIRPKYHRKSDLNYLTHLNDFVIQKILDNEMDEYSKNNLADYVIQNYNPSGNPQSDIVIGLESQVKRIHKKLLMKSIPYGFI